METQDRIAKGDPLQKMGSAGFIIGAASPGIAEQAVPFQSSALLPVSGYRAVMVGMAGAYRSITTRGAARARVGVHLSKGHLRVGIGVVLLTLFGLQGLAADDLGRYAAHPNPITDYAEAVRRVEAKIASEAGFYEGSHSFVLTHGARTEKVIILAHGIGSSPYSFKQIAAEFYDRGYNVLALTMPRHGLADTRTTEQEKMRVEEWTRFGDEVVDIAHGLGERVTMVGISGGGMVAAWVAEQRTDVYRVVAISPGLGAKSIPRFLTPLAAWFFNSFPNFYVEDDPKKDRPRPYNYARISSKLAGQILKFGGIIKKMARKEAPAAGSIVVVTNLNDPDVDTVAVDRVAALWQKRRPNDVTTYQFPAELGLGHDLIDVTDPHMNVGVVYPKLFELIDQ